jgi:hypothetical protein
VSLRVNVYDLLIPRGRAQTSYSIGYQCRRLEEAGLLLVLLELYTLI